MRFATHGSFALCLAMLCSVGCGRLSTQYGASNGQSGRTSLNGFGALRRSYVNAGVESRDASRLTSRVRGNDIIVWTPQLLSPIATDTTHWFDNWLATGNKTLVYIVPDSGSESEYWSDATHLAPSIQRLQYRKQSARVINEQMAWRLERQSIHGSGWFNVEPFASRESAGTLVGDWAAVISEPTDNTTNLITELTIRESSEAESGTAVATFSFTPTGPAAPTYPLPTIGSASSESVTLTPLLESQSGQAIVTKITSDNWSGSQILVVAGGSLLTNYAFTRPQHRRLADQLIVSSIPESTENPTAAFISSRWSTLPVSDGKPKVPAASGMELLTVWPISLVTMHGVLLTCIIGLAVLPIFGRPRRVRVRRQRDFGDHLDAVAALMNKTGGEEFARQRIREYRKRIHGEVFSESQDDLGSTTQPTQSATNEEAR